MAVFRVEKTKDFTIMSNHHLRNTELSLKAKGLLSLMLSLPEDWDYTTKGLAHICKDGVDSITTALKELERHGYLTRQRLRYDNGQLGDIEYTIHEQPVSTENTGLSPKRENPRQVKPEQAKPKQAEPEQENPAQLNTNPLKTKKSKKDKSITYPSIYAETMKKQVILHLPYVLFLLVFAKLGEAVRLAPGADASQKLLGLSEGFALAFQSMWPGAAMDWLIGLCGAAIMRLAVYLRGKDAKKYRKNVEYGSARWGNKADIAPFMDPKPENNIILTQSEGLMLNGRPKNPANARNKNVLVVGGSGSGKTRFFIKPNLMQMHSSYVVTDPKGTVLVECGKMLQRGTPKLDKDGKPVRNEKGKIIYEPYKIRVFNTINFQKSMHFNPFAYIHSEKDILKIVTTLISNTKGEGKAGDDFWVKAETLLYTALIGYIYYEAPANEQNFATLVEMLNAMEVREDDESFKNAVDLLFDALEQKDPDHFALRQYKKYKLAAGDICSK